MKIVLFSLFVAFLVQARGDDKFVIEHKEPKNFEDAKKLCEGLTPPKKLAQKLDADTLKAIHAQMVKDKVPRAWIGIKSDAPAPKPGEGKDKFKYIDFPAEAVAEDMWGDKEPNNFKNHNELCGEVRLHELDKSTPDGGKQKDTAPEKSINDQPCETLSAAVCMEVA